jgi:hypothetical protein
MNRNLVRLASAVCGVLLVGCTTRAGSQEARDEALTCPKIQAEVDAQDPAARRDTGTARSLEAGASAYQAAEWLPIWEACCRSWTCRRMPRGREA